MPLSMRLRAGLACILVSLVAQTAGLPAEKPAGQSDAKASAKSGGAATVITHADADKAAKLVDAKKVVVIDVRTSDEFSTARIAGATNIDFQSADFEKRLSSLDRDKTYLVHCAAGGRSTRSLETFKKLGFKSVVHLDGGMSAWQKAKKPVEEGKPKE